MRYRYGIHSYLNVPSGAVLELSCKRSDCIARSCKNEIQRGDDTRGVRSSCFEELRAFVDLQGKLHIYAN